MPRAFYCLLNVCYLPCMLIHKSFFIYLESVASFIQDKEHCQHLREGLYVMLSFSV